MDVKHCLNKLKFQLQNMLLWPNTNHTFFTTVDFSLIGTGSVLFQMNDRGNMDIIFYISRIFNTNEQKFCTACRELIGIVQSPTIYEHIKTCSDPLNIVLSDHKRDLSSFIKKFNRPPSFYAAQMQLFEF